MSNIEDTKPMDALASRVWSGTHWYYPHIERMVAELTRLRAEVERLTKYVDGQDLRSDFKTATEMRAELTALRAVAEAAEKWIEANTAGAINDECRAIGQLRTTLAAWKAASKPAPAEGGG